MLCIRFPQIIFVAALACSFVAYASPEGWQQFQESHLLGARATEGQRSGPTTSEGQGLAMLQAVAAGDRTAFHALWTFAQVRLQQPSGLLAWKWEPRTGVVDSNNATLGDLYVAWALQRAALAWQAPAYAVHAERIADALLDRCVALRDGRAYLLPAAVGYAKELKGSSDLRLNPGHWALPAFQSFQSFERGSEWQAVHSAAVAGFASIAQGNGNQGMPAMVTWSRGAYQSEKGADDAGERVSVFLRWSGELPQLQALLARPQQPGFPSTLYAQGVKFLHEQAELAQVQPKVSR